MILTSDRRRRVTAIAVAVVAVVASASAAFAYFTATNGGTGTIPVDASSPWVLTSRPITGLTPVTPPVHIVGTATNPDNQHEYIGTVTPTVASTSNAGCTAADFTITPGVINADEPSGAAGLNFGTIAFNDTNANQNACEDVSVTLSFTSN